ncbi:XRE family transcriptional regulator [Coprobacillus sp. AF16-47]|jgi:transcriptional regulator with XRE-family HTH domain|nr:XRE family transcriptional regulator [Coprobacillus sp. AF16-47]
MNIAQNIRMLRKEKNLTQKELGALLNIPYRTIMNWERGIRQPSSQNMVILEEFFGVSGAFLRGETESRERMAWDDQELMQTIHSEIPAAIASFSAELLKQSDKNQKLMFDLFIELKSILSLDDEKTKDDLIDLIHQNVCSIVRVSNKLPK